MTAYISYLLKFLFRIKWWLILCPTIVALLVYIKMGSMARTYKAATTIYTGVVSGYNAETGESSKNDWNMINNAMDNLINIVQSQTTLKNVSMRLYAQNMMYGNPDADNNFITAQHYRQEVNVTPKEVLALIDRENEEQTLANLRAYETASHANHVYGLFHWPHRYYGYEALRTIQVKRIGNSDMLEISYENDDPGIVYNTLQLLNQEFVNYYKELQFGETNNVIAFFESELNRVGSELRSLEDSLRDYNVDNLVINYDEQTKHIAILSRDFELKFEDIRLNYSSAESLRQAIEKQIDMNTFRRNAAFVEKLHSIGDLQARITTAETFSPDGSQKNKKTDPREIATLRNRLDRETDSLRQITSAISIQRYTKEGIATTSLVQQWLDAVLLSTKSEAELSVIYDWKKSLDERYERYAPVGAVLKRKNREIGFQENSYQALLNALNTARLRQKNLQMSSATLRIINPPVLPISAEPTKRKMMVIAAFGLTLVFLLGFFLLLELLDRTLRDKIRAERITRGRVLGAFPGQGRMGQRRFTQQYREIAARALGNAALNYFNPANHPNVINLLSTASGDGKSQLAEQLAAYFTESGMKVRIVSWNKDFNAESREFLLAEHLSDLVKDKPNQVPLADADVVLAEYPPLNEHTTPRELLRQSVLNLVVAPANRTWKDTDQMLFEKCVAQSGSVPTEICLNNASRDVVESFTGMLPPYTRLRKFGYQIAQFGFTAVK